MASAKHHYHDPDPVSGLLPPPHTKRGSAVWGNAWSLEGSTGNVETRELGACKLYINAVIVPWVSLGFYTLSRSRSPAGTSLLVYDLATPKSLWFYFLFCFWLLRVMAGDFPNLSASTISQWPKPNPIDPITRGWYPPLAVTLTCLSTAALLARVWSQLKRSTFGFGVDDLLASIACFFAIVYSASSILGTLKFGFDRHIWDTNHHRHAALIQWLSEGAFILSICIAKISVLCFYRRLEPSCTKVLRLILYGFISLTALYSFGCLLAQTLLCHPTSAYWRIPSLTRPVARSCSSQHFYYPIQGFLDSLSTLYCILIPVLVLRSIPMSQFQRTGLRAVSVASIIVLGASIARAVFLSRLADSINGDATWNGFNVFVCSQLECQLLLVFASAPFLHRLVSQSSSLSIVNVYPEHKARNNSVVSRVGTSLSDQIKRLPFGRSNSPRKSEISRPQPQMVEIPDWEFRTLESPQSLRSPMDEHTYDRYLAGIYGPPAPPKDSRTLFDQYRREHGEIV